MREKILNHDNQMFQRMKTVFGHAIIPEGSASAVYNCKFDLEDKFIILPSLGLIESKNVDKMNKEYFKRFVKPETEEIKNNEVWVYTRVSSKNQFDSNHSIENQIYYATRLAEKIGYKITREFGNTYESAKDDFTRKEFTKLINEVKESKKKPFGIMIYKMSRFSRSGGSAIGLVDDLGKFFGLKSLCIV